MNKRAAQEKRRVSSPYHATMEGELGDITDGQWRPTVRAAATRIIVPGLPPLVVAAGRHGFEAIVAFVDSPARLFVQLVANAAVIKHVAALMSTVYGGATDGDCEETATATDSDLKPGGLCAARYWLDNHWYRAVVVDVAERVTVYFVDYGDTEAVERVNVQPLPDELRATPPQAVEVALSGTVGHHVDLASFRSAMENQRVVVKLEKLQQTHGFVVRLQSSGANSFCWNDAVAGRTTAPPVAVADDEQCCVCLERPPNTVFQPCGHTCCCRHCNRNLPNRTCPICRATITTVQHA